MGDPVTRDELVFDVAYALGFVASLPRRLTEDERKLIAGQVVDHLLSLGGIGDDSRCAP